MKPWFASVLRPGHGLRTSPGPGFAYCVNLGSAGLGPGITEEAADGYAAARYGNAIATEAAMVFMSDAALSNLFCGKWNACYERFPR